MSSRNSARNGQPTATPKTRDDGLKGWGIDKSDPDTVKAPTIIPANRARMACQANYETEALLYTLLHTVDQGNPFSTETLTRSVAVRLLQLNSVLVSALGGEEAWPADDMERELYGPVKPARSGCNEVARHD